MNDVSICEYMSGTGREKICLDKKTTHNKNQSTDQKLNHLEHSITLCFVVTENDVTTWIVGLRYLLLGIWQR